LNVDEVIAMDLQIFANMLDDIEIVTAVSGRNGSGELSSRKCLFVSLPIVVNISADMS